MNKNRIFVVTTLFFLSCTAIKGMEERPGRYTLKTSDGIDISVSQDFINKSETLKKLVEDISGNEPIPLPTIDSETLRKLIGISKDITKLDGQNEKTLIVLANAADYLGMEELLDLIIEKLKTYYTSANYLSSFFFGQGSQLVESFGFNALNRSVQSKLAQNIMQDVIEFFYFPLKEFEIKGLIIYSPDGKQLASGSDDGIVKIWDAQTGQPIRILGERQDWVNSIAYSPDGKQLAVPNDRTIKIWNPQTGQLLHVLGNENHVNSIAYSTDGQQLASGSDDGIVKIWHVQTDQLIHTLEGHQGSVFSVAYSPDGKQLASGGFDRTVKIWDAQTGQLIRSLEGHENHVEKLAYSPDGKQLASGGFDRTVKIWDAQTGQLIHTLAGGVMVRSLVYSPDGRQLALGSFGSIKIWDAQTGQLIYALGNQEGVNSVDYSPDGKQLAVAAQIRRTSIYSVLPFAQKKALKNITEIPQALLLQFIKKIYEKYKKPLAFSDSLRLFEVFNTLPENIRTYLQGVWIRE